LVLYFTCCTLPLYEEAGKINPSTSLKMYLSQEGIYTANTGGRANFTRANAPALPCFAAVFKGSPCINKFSFFNLVRNSMCQEQHLLVDFRMNGRSLCSLLTCTRAVTCISHLLPYDHATDQGPPLQNHNLRKECIHIITSRTRRQNGKRLYRRVLFSIPV